MSPKAFSLILPLTVCSTEPVAINRLPPDSISSVPAVVLMAPAAAKLIAPLLITLALPLPASSAAFRSSVPTTLSSRWPLPAAVTALLIVVLPPDTSTIAPLPATVSPLSVTASCMVEPVTVPSLLTRLTCAAVLVTLATVSAKAPWRKNAPPLLTLTASVLTTVSSKLLPVPMPVPALSRKLLAVTLAIAIVSSDSCASTMLPLAVMLTLPAPVEIIPTTVLPALLTMRTLPSLVCNCASASIRMAPPACTSIVLPLPLVCTLGKLFAKLSPTTTSRLASNVRLPLLLVILPATVRSTAGLCVCSNKLPLLPVKLAGPLKVMAPLLLVTTMSPPKPPRLTALMIRSVASTKYSPPLSVLLAAIDLTRVYSGAALAPIPLAALNVTSAVSPSMLLPLPVKLSMIMPAVAVKLTVASAKMTLRLMLPVSASMLTCPP